MQVTESPARLASMAQARPVGPAPTMTTSKEKLSSMGEGPRSILLVAESFHAGQLLAFEELQRRPASGGDVRDLVSHTGGFHRGHAVAASDDGNRSPVIGHRLRNLLGAFGERLDFKYAHRSVPDNRSGNADFVGEQLHRLRSNIERHHVGRNGFA